MRKYPAVFSLGAHGNDLYFLLDTKAVPNILSTNHIIYLQLSSSFKKAVTVIDGSMDTSDRTVTNMFVMFSELKAKMISFLLMSC